MTPTSSQRAFTLIEVLVVLLIVAIMTGIAVMAFGQFGRGRREKIIVQQFVRVISVAQQQAILTPSVLGLGITEKGYRFYQYDAATEKKLAQWIPLNTTALSQPDAFKKVFHVTVKIISGFDSKSTDQKAQQPQILFLPSGFVTPFILELKGTKHNFFVDVKNNGVVNLSEKN